MHWRQGQRVTVLLNVGHCYMISGPLIEQLEREELIEVNMWLFVLRSKYLCIFLKMYIT